MTSYLRKALLVPWKPNLQIVRHRNKINIQRPAAPHYERAKVMHITRPFYPVSRIINQKPSVENCTKRQEPKLKKVEAENMYAKILAKELYTYTDSSQFVGFFHRCPITAEEIFNVRVALKKVQGTFKIYGRMVTEMAWQNTYYEPALCLLKSHTAFVFCPEGTPETVAGVIKIFRRVKNLFLMAAIIDKKMMDYDELLWYSKLSDLTTEQAKLASMLSFAGGASLMHDLNSLQSNLVHQLSQRATQLEKSSASETSGDNSVVEIK